MTGHAVLAQHVPADAATAFALVHDYGRRLQWDTLLRRAATEGSVPPGRGVVAVCSARRRLGGLTFRTRYVTWRPPHLAAVTLVDPHPLFATWAASLRHADRPDGTSDLTYTLTFRCRPAATARVVEPVALAAFRAETRRRLAALAAHLARA